MRMEKKKKEEEDGNSKKTKKRRKSVLDILKTGICIYVKILWYI